MPGKGGDILRLYQWHAISSSGKKYNGEYVAENEKEVIDFVHRNYGYVTEVEAVREKKSLFRWFWPQLNFTDRERANFFKQLSALLEAGIPVAKAMGMVTSGLSEKFRPVCRQISANLQCGRSLSYAMSLQPEMFSRMDVSLIEAGEASGQLIYVLQSLSDYYNRQDKILKLARNACIYPAFLLILAFLTVTFFGLKLIPAFAELYQSLGIEETTLLKVMLSFSKILQDHTVALSCVILVIAKALILRREWIFTRIVRLPVIRVMHHSVMEIRFVRLMALMLQSGIAFPEAILRSSVTLTDDSMRDKAKTFSDNVLRGVAISDAAVMAGNLFSKTGLEFLNIGEKSGKLPYMLSEYAALSEQELFTRLRDLKTVMEPALVSIVAAIIFAVMAIMLSPLFTLMAQMPELN
ncbi:MAG: type II secretion system F family protein [Acidaminococcaceae bacterium]|nr:type II secretion system F family protein [Acidaminococcaceae bacterium]